MSAAPDETRLKALMSFLEDDPNDVFTHYAIALEFERLKQPRVAIEKLREALKLDSCYVAAYQQLGRIQHAIGETEQGMAALTEGIGVARKIGDSHAAAEMTEELEQMKEEL